MGGFPYGCHRCKESFDSKEEQLNHMNYEHIRCGFCKEWLDSGLEILQHEAEYHNCCEDCQEDFNSYNDLRQHMHVHLPRDKQCFGCTRMFESYSAMLIHLEAGNCKTTMANLDFDAQECFQHKKYIVEGYKEMLRTQTRDSYRVGLGWNAYSRLWECGGCNKDFSDKAAGLAHSSSPIHDPKPYKCPGCGTLFKTLSALVQHVESDHCGATVSPPGPIWKLLNYLGNRVSQG
ncbi:hypothetical protein MMC30_008015 [Trapelia coarctata]|nr:hypothetical protein [Trapelia coarctata]